MTTGRYLLLDRVGVGGMAEVFRAKALGADGFDRLVAIKRIRPALAADAQFVQMFVDEARIAGQLHHENIARIHELGTMQGTHFIAMEYVFGKNLLQLLSRLEHANQVMAPQMAAWITVKMLTALHYAHTKVAPDGRPLALIHRDISPQNVLLSYDGAVKLIDFGVAKASNRIHQTFGRIVKGKVGYMSPQQIMGEPIDHRSDVFAASTCLHEMLTSRRLFSGSTDADVINRVRGADAPPPTSINAGIPQELEGIVMRGLSLRPDDRWQTAEEMGAALLRFIGHHQTAFDTAQLSSLMRTIFADEIAREWPHLNELGQVVQPGVHVQSTREATQPDTQPDLFVSQQTMLGSGPLRASGEVSQLAPVERIIAVGAPSPSDEACEPFLLVSRPPPPPDALPDEFMPGSTMNFPMVLEPGAFDTADTGEDFSAPFLGSARVGEAMVAVPVPGGSIPDLPAMTPPAPPALSAAAPPVAAALGVSWLLVGLIAVVALLMGAGGVLVALYAAGVLPPR